MKTVKEWAELLNGREYRKEISRAEGAQAKEDGVVVVYGASDDLMEFDGAIHDEVGAYNGGEAYVTPSGLFSAPDSCEDCHSCRYVKAERAKAVEIKAIWEPKMMDGASWLIEMPDSIPHEHFDTFEDGELYSRGLVFRLADVALAGN